MSRLEAASGGHQLSVVVSGVSSGANLVAALRVAAGRKDAIVVTIFCDSASKYLSETFWQDTISEAENWP